MALRHQNDKSRTILLWQDIVDTWRNVVIPLLNYNIHSPLMQNLVLSDSILAVLALNFDQYLSDFGQSLSIVHGIIILISTVTNDFIHKIRTLRSKVWFIEYTR